MNSKTFLFIIILFFIISNFNCSNKKENFSACEDCFDKCSGCKDCDCMLNCLDNNRCSLDGLKDNCNDDDLTNCRL
jgi:hypothetical protein